jgi:hypothetical protein
VFETLPMMTPPNGADRNEVILVILHHILVEIDAPREFRVLTSNRFETAWVIG